MSSTIFSLNIKHFHIRLSIERELPLKELTQESVIRQAQLIDAFVENKNKALVKHHYLNSSY